MVNMILPWLFYKIHWATKKFCLGFYYVVNSYIFINSIEIYKLKANDFQINAAALCLGNVSKYL